MKRVSERFPNLRAAAAFYGVAHGAFTELKKMGADNNDPLPYEDPTSMPAWFGRMIDCGARKRPCPSSVLMRAVEAEKGGETPAVSVASRPAKKAHPGKIHAGPTAAPVSELPPLVLDAESTPSDIISRQRRLHAALNVRYLEIVENRQDQTAEGMAVYRQITALEEAILKWSKAEKELRDPDEWMRRSEVQTQAVEFARRFYALIRLELGKEFPREEARVQAAMDAIGERLPALLPKAMSEAREAA